MSDGWPAQPGADPSGSGLTPVPRLLLTVEQVAEALAIGRTAVYELISSQRLGSVRIGGSRRIPIPALQRFVAQLSGETPAT